MGISTPMHARTCSLATPHTGSTVHSQLLRSTWALPARPCALAASQTSKLTACRVAALRPNLTGVPHRRLAVSQPRGLPRSLAALRPRGIPRSLAASRHPSQPRGFAALRPRAMPLRSLSTSRRFCVAITVRGCHSCRHRLPMVVTCRWLRWIEISGFTVSRDTGRHPACRAEGFLATQCPSHRRPFATSIALISTPDSPRI